MLTSKGTDPGDEDEIGDGVAFVVAGSISPMLCGGATLDTILSVIRQASDIRADGTNGPGAACDAISIGIGFTAKQIGPAKTLAKPTPPAPDPCADAGAGGGDAGDGG